MAYEEHIDELAVAVEGRAHCSISLAELILKRSFDCARISALVFIISIKRAPLRMLY